MKTYLPGAPAALASVTLHQLLTHTGGLPEYCGEDFDRMPLATMLSGCLSQAAGVRAGHWLRLLQSRLQLY